MADCPRCKLILKTEAYEGHDVLFCESCWGHWMTQDIFTQILKSEQYSFNNEEEESVLRGWVTAASNFNDDLDKVVSCPICKGTTERKPFSDDCNVILDVCHDHGVWLDASEIKQVQIYFDSLK